MRNSLVKVSRGFYHVSCPGLNEIRDTRYAIRGITTVMALFVMLVLVTIGLVIAAILANEGWILVAQTYGQASYFLADAGIELGIRAIRDDVTSTTAYGKADLRPGTAQGTGGSGSLTERQEQMDRIRYYDEPADPAVTLYPEGSGTYVVARDFDQTYAGLGSQLAASGTVVQIGCRYRLASAPVGGTYPTLTVDYTVNGTFSDAAVGPFIATVDSDSWNTSLIVLDISSGLSPWTWDDLMALGTDHSTNFAVRATASGSAEYKVEIDCIFLRVTYEIDHHHEAWFTDWSNDDESPKVVEIPLGVPAGADRTASNVYSLSVLDEDGKINLNYADRWLMAALFQNCGLSRDIYALSDAIIAYRTGTGLFRLPKEVSQIDISPRLSEDEQALFAPYVTLFSGVNRYARRPESTRAAVNINTASATVLKSIFYAESMLGLMPAEHIDHLTDNIIAQRATAPFTCFYSLDPAVTTDFYDFMRSQDYLTGSQQDYVLDNASPSLLVPVPGTSHNCDSANFSYGSNAFTIDCLAKKPPAQRRVKVIGFDDGSFGPVIE